MLATDRLDLLKLFVRIVETGKVTDAARSMGLSQPSASRCLKQLEALLDTRLVQRSAHGLGLTPSGRDFLPHARRLLADWDAAVEGAAADRQAIAGRIRIAAPIALGQGVLASIAARFIKDHPGVMIDWDLRDDAVDLVAAGYDLWIRAGEIRRDDLVVRAIYSAQRAIVTAPCHESVAHPRSLQAKGAVRLSTFVPSSIELTSEGGSVFVLRQKAAFTTDNLYAAHTAVLEGVGYAILPLWLVQADLHRGTLLRTCRAWRPPDVTLSLAYPPNPRRPARIDAFADRLKAELTRQDGLGITFLETFQAKDTVLIV